MPNEENVIRLDLAKRLHELGVRKDTVFYWRGVSNNTNPEPSKWYYSWRVVLSGTRVDENVNNARLRQYPAFTVAELLKIMPGRNKRWDIENKWANDWWCV